MKKLLSGIILATFVFVTPISTFADTATSTTAISQVQALMTQIQNLQTQIKSLQALQTQVQTATTGVVSTLQLIRNLREGMTGADVTALQTILAADPTIYPEGTVTGYYGRLTSQAMKKFQKKYGIEAVGFVGPKTLKKLNEVIKELGLVQEKDENNSNVSSNNQNSEQKGNKLCIPPGHLIAPGWLKKNDKPTPSATVPLCNNKQNNDNEENHVITQDTIAPVISGVNTLNLLATTTSIVWTTNEASDSKVWFGAVNPVNLTLTPSSSAGFVTNHSILLSGLATSTIYYYVVGSADSSGNIATSTQGAFTTTSGL